MKFCSRCVMPDTRPGTQIDGSGVCLACLNHEDRKSVNWETRWFELVELFKRYAGKSYYDCAVAVSGGKDSHYLVNIVKNKLGMNPLLIRIGDGFSNTIAGTRNIRNLSDVFDCDMVQFDLSIDKYRELTRSCFEEYANFPFVDGTVYSFPVQIAQKYSIPLLIYGENPEYEYGTGGGDNPDAATHIQKNMDLMCRLGFNCPYLPLNDVRVIFMSYYVPWNGYDNYLLAKQYGFRDLTHEWKREGHVEDWDQIDICGWEISHFLKFIKFGYGRVTDITSRWVREGHITRQKAVGLVNEYDGRLDQKALDDFLSFTGYTVREFWKISNQWWNKDIFENKNGVWYKKDECKLK